MRAYHGNHESAVVLHPGLCLTESDDAVREYGRPGYHRPGWVHTLELDLDALGLIIVAMDGYDHDANVAPGDDGDYCGADVLVYDDETDTGRRHGTYRLMTPAALAAVTVTGSERTAEDE